MSVMTELVQVRGGVTKWSVSSTMSAAEYREKKTRGVPSVGHSVIVGMQGENEFTRDERRECSSIKVQGRRVRYEM